MRLFAVFDTDHTDSTSIAILDRIMSEGEELGGIMVYDVSYTNSSNVMLKENRRPPNMLDDRGASKFCSSLLKDTKELIVGRNEGIFSYSIEYRGSAVAFEGEKLCISTVGKYVLVANLDEKTKRNNITIYDLRNKFISFSGQIAIGENIKFITNDSGMLYLLTSSHMLIRYREKDTTSKIDVLLKKSLYPLAIALASEEQIDVTEIMKLFKMYGDHLYKKGEFDAAMTQYMATIGFVQSSYIIRRYLEPHRIYNLIAYLEKIQERGIANKEHKTLLLSCYTKVKEEKKIKEFFINQKVIPETSETQTEQDPIVLAENAIGTIDDNLDCDACIEVLAAAGYVDFALQLASMYEMHHKYLELFVSCCNISSTLYMN